jgi:hypothetical protein
MKAPVHLSVAIFGGGAAIYAVLWLLASYTPLNASKTLVLFIPLSLLWVAACILWSTLRARKEHKAKNDMPKQKSV